MSTPHRPPPATIAPRPLRRDDPAVFIYSTRAALRRRDRARFIERQVAQNSGRYPWATPLPDKPDSAA